jgi:hypothetical protein
MGLFCCDDLGVEVVANPWKVSGFSWKSCGFTRSFCLFLHQFVEVVTCERAVSVDSLRKCVVF